ncbi:hypothetical protein IAE22_35120, partial [Bacillus sp. S34]|nr:hypothetical protein [Bacillus sp. S34]
ADLHAHGSLRHDFATCTADDAVAAAAHHRAHGTTTLVASIATGTLDDTENAWLATLVDSLGDALRALHRVPAPAGLLPPWLRG